MTSDWGHLFTTITAFTLGRSVTLGLVAWGLLKVHSDRVESAIVGSMGVSVCQPMLSAPWYPTRVVRGLSWALMAFSLVLLPRFAGWY